MNKTILSKLGDYLLAHREEIIDEWLRAAEQNPDITSLGHLKDKEELTDHLPELCQNLAKLLKSPQSDQNRAEVLRAARFHGRHRWQQGYRLEEVIREASVVRRIISHRWLDAYAGKRQSWTAKLEEQRKISFTRPLTMSLGTRLRSLSKNSYKATSHLNSQLADALAEVRQEKGAAEAAKTTKKRKRPRR